MTRLIASALLCICTAAPLYAQRPDSTKARADSVAQARADSIALVQELERMSRDTAPARPPQGTQQGPTNPRLLPDFSAVGDFVGDLSPDGSTQEGGCRLCVREVELAVQAAVDPFFRGDVFLGISDEEGIAIEQAFLTTTALPASLEVRLGRQLLPFGKINTTHRHDLHTVEYPWVIQKFFGPEGLKGTGVYVSRIFAPLGFYQELIVTANDRFGEAPEDLTPFEPPNKALDGMTYHARLRNYFDVSESSNFELSASALTGKVEQPFDVDCSAASCDLGLGASSFVTGEDGTPNAVLSRQSIVGADATFRWRPLQQGLYRSFIAQAEVMYQRNHGEIVLPTCTAPTPGDSCDVTYAGPRRNFTGAYGFARWQMTQRLYVSGRYDWVEDPMSAVAPGRIFTAASGYLEWFPSEFSKLMAGYERLMPTGLDGLNRILLQASFALGPHKPHPF